MEMFMIFLVAGIVLGLRDVFNYKTKLWLNRFSTLCLFIILFCLGAKIGCDKEMLERIPVLGRQAFVLGGCAIAGTIVVFYFIIRILAPRFDEESE